MTIQKNKAKVSICFTVLSLPGHLGGIGNYAYHLIKNIQVLEPDWNLTLLVSPSLASQFADLKNLNLFSPRISTRFFRLLYFHLVFRFKCGSFNVLHSLGNIGMVACPIPQVITLHDCYENVSPERFNRFKRALMGWLIRLSGRQAFSILTDSKSSQADIFRFYPELRNKTRVVYLGNKYEVTDTIFAGHSRYYLFVGTLEPGKNLAHLLEAISRLPKEINCTLKVVGGKGWKQSELPSLIETLGVSHAVEFLGYVSDQELKELYHKSIALVLPSSYEGFGLPAIEAMALACPVILANNSSLPEAGGDAALYFPTGDVAALIDCMKRVYMDAQLRSDLVAKGFKHAQLFRWEKTAYETIQEIRKAIKQ